MLSPTSERRSAAEVTELAELEQQLRVIDAPIENLQRQIETATSSEAADRARDELATLRADFAGERIDVQRSIETLSARVQETADLRPVFDNPEISARMQQEAKLPGSPISPKTNRNVLLGLILGLLAGAGASLLWESIDDKLSAEDDLAALGVNVLASVPVDGEDLDGPRLFVRDAPEGREMEGYRTARAALNFASSGGLSSFLVTSALPSEGKSTTSANLAVALSMAGQKTLLIDADLRRPTLHNYFNMPNNVGLRSILAGEADANDVMTVTGIGEMLALIPAGSVASYPSEFLSNGNLESLVAGAKQVFDVVIIDTPPLFLVSDAALVAPSVDGIVLSVTGGMGETTASKKSDTRRLLSAVRRLRTPVLGAVFHGRGPSSYGYGYKGYYGSDIEAEPETPVMNGTRPPTAALPQAEEPNVGWIEDRINVGRMSRS